MKQLDRIEKALVEIRELLQYHNAPTKREGARDWLIAYLKTCPDRADLPRRIEHEAREAGIARSALHEARRELTLIGRVRVERQPGKTDWLWCLVPEQRKKK
jgi:hypothetical protein